MAKTAIIKTTLYTSGDGVNDNFQDTSLAIASAAYKDETFTLASGVNTLTPPTAATYLYISNGSVTLIVKGVTGDTGWTIGLGKSAMLPLGAAPYALTASGTGTVDLKWR